MTATVNELRGHGDELLVAAMKNMSVKEKVTEEPTKERPRETFGHGDPLFQEVLSHDTSPPKMALHSEFSGHGDEILDAVIEHWPKPLKEAVAKPKKLHQVIHTEFQTQGDPILKQYRDHLNINGKGGESSNRVE